MSFSLNNPWDKIDVAYLLASVKDDRNWRLVVDKKGNVSLLDCSANVTPFEDLHCYFETWVQGNDYVGEKAAFDGQHVGELVRSLRDNWPVLRAGDYIDH